MDKLGIKPGHAVALVDMAGSLDEDLRRKALARSGRAPVSEDEAVDVTLVSIDSSTDAVVVLKEWRQRLHPAGGIWLLTPKRGRQGYVDQHELIQAGLAAGLVDNKGCSVSDVTSGMRFVIRKADR